MTAFTASLDRFAAALVVRSDDEILLDVALERHPSWTSGAEWRADGSLWLFVSRRNPPSDIEIECWRQTVSAAVRAEEGSEP